MRATTIKDGSPRFMSQILLDMQAAPTGASADSAEVRAVEPGEVSAVRKSVTVPAPELPSAYANRNFFYVNSYDLSDLVAGRTGIPTPIRIDAGTSERVIRPPSSRSHKILKGLGNISGLRVERFKTLKSTLLEYTNDGTRYRTAILDPEHDPLSLSSLMNFLDSLKHNIDVTQIINQKGEKIFHFKTPSLISDFQVEQIPRLKSKILTYTMGGKKYRVAILDPENDQSSLFPLINFLGSQNKNVDVIKIRNSKGKDIFNFEIIPPFLKEYDPLARDNLDFMGSQDFNFWKLQFYSLFQASKQRIVRVINEKATLIFWPTGSRMKYPLPISYENFRIDAVTLEGELSISLDNTSGPSEVTLQALTPTISIHYLMKRSRPPMVRTPRFHQHALLRSAIGR